MSWQIPTQIESDIISGKAQYRTFQTGVGGQSILPVPNNAYAVIFGYDFSPAGGGIQFIQVINQNPEATAELFRWFETQQISFYTGTDFYPFVHHVNSEVSGFSFGDVQRSNITIDNTPIARQVYITSDKDITITHGLILNSIVATTGAIPQTNRTPALLTYGGAPQAVAAQTDFGPAASPLQFMQPSPKDFQDFGFGLLPNNASGQLFATPDATRGLRDSSAYLATLGAQNNAASHYYLNLHYALYTESVPEQRG